MSGRARTGRLLAGCVLAALSLGCREGAPPQVKVVPGGDPTRGQRLIAAYGCGACHTVPGVPGARGAVGPPLTEFGRRVYIAGNLRNEPAQLVRWIRFPQEVEPGTVMPTLGVTDGHARDIAAYLYTLTGDALGPPRLFSPRVLPTH